MTEYDCDNYPLPETIKRMTINELMLDPNTEVTIKGTHVKMRRQSENSILIFEYDKYADDRGNSSTPSSSARELKRDFESDILEMKRQGMTQKQIAFRLGISESYISKLLHKKPHASQQS